MGYVLQDRIEVSLFFSGTEFPLVGINVLNSLQMDMSVKVMVPTINLVVTDEMEVIAQSSLVQDGTPISVVIKALGTTESKTYTFRVFKYKSFKATIGTMYEIDGYWDCQQYWLQTTSKGVRGTSNYVLQSIAQACGLKYEGTATSDSMLWLPQNRTYSQFAKKITERGYASDSSVMVLGLTLDNVLRYKDFHEPAPDNIVDVILGEYAQGKRMVVDYNPKNNGGFNNMLTGYNNMRVSQSAKGEEVHTAYDSLAFTPDSKTPFYSKDVKATAQRGNVLYSAIDFGNTHPMYERALYQNQRYRNLLNAGVDFMSVIPTNLDLFDSFNFIDRQPDDQSLNTSWSGVYKLTSKAIRVEGASYIEMFEGYRHGTNVGK